ncbi:MAG TPA: tetratricopeptide repeat protein [Methylomirabilota bacterium]|nr:tetratricopeptide repeat protein [Methylomirabilota bacterium]
MFDAIKQKMMSKSDMAMAQPMTEASRFNKAINFCLYALVLLVPILFSSLTSEPREFNKQALIFLGVVVLLGIWVLKILTTRNFSWVKTPLDFVLLGYLAIYLVASLFSVDKVSSFLGYYGRFAGGFISILALIILYFLVVNNLKQERTIRKLVKYYLFGTGIVLIYSLLQILGLYIIPGAFTHSRGFNPIGSQAGLAIFASLSIVFLQWLFFIEPVRSKVKSLVYWVLTFVALAIVFLINAFASWLVLALAMIVFLALAMSSMDKSSAQGGQMSAMWFWKPMLLLVIAVLFVAFRFLPASLNPRNLVTVNLPVEIQLSNKTTWTLVSNSIKSSIKTAVVGSGPGTVGIKFGDIKPESLNKTIVWSLNFDRASSEVANIIIETGILGLLAFELVSIMFLIYGLMFLFRKTQEAGWKYAFGFFMIWVALYIAHFTYFFNTTFYFLYWLSIALFMALANHSNQEEESSSIINSSSRSTMSWMFVSLLLLAALLVGTFFETAVYGAEVSYTSGIKELNKTKPDYSRVSADFGRAITLNPYRDNYLLAYGQNLIFLASQEAAKDKPDVAQVRTWIGNLIAAGNKATQVSPAKAANWSALAQFYTNIRTLVAGTDPHIIDAWQKAIERDPKNPALYIQLAQAYSAASQVIDPAIVGSGPDADQDGLSDDKESQLHSDPHNSDTNGNGVSDGDEVKAGFDPVSGLKLTGTVLASFTSTDQAMLNKAQDALNTAISLKQDLPDGYIALSRILEKSNKLDEARKKIDEAAKLFPNNPDILFEQGRITFNQKDLVTAEKIFKNVIALSPNHANAHYSLGLIYQQKGDTAGALTEFEKAEEIAGPNVDLEKLINSLKTPAAPTPTPNQ